MKGVFMPELLIPIFLFFVIYLYLTMKKLTTSSENLTSKAKTEQPAAVATEAKTKNISPPQKPSNKQKAMTLKPMTKEKTELPIAVAATKSKPKKTNPTQKASEKIKPVELLAEASMPEMAMPELVGLTAGDIWHYLDKNGATAVAKLVRDLPEEEKIIQRSIGWLAQEGKIALDTIDRVETISLAG
jgi:Winged helix-turn-helix domain (DUF2582)